MNKLKECFEVINNPNCVILKVKENKEEDLIFSGFFLGTEKMFRITKGKNHECTTWFKNGNISSWEYGYNGHTLVTEQTRNKWDIINKIILQENIDIRKIGV